MKGLLIKDLQLTLANKQVALVLLFVGASLLFFGKEESMIFAISYISFMCGIVAITTISYDEYDHSNAFLMTMPITRKMYVIEKYVLFFLLLLLGWSVSVILGSVISLSGGNGILWKELLTVGLGVLVPVCIISMMMLPVQLKFGSDHGRMVIFGFVAGLMVLVFLGKAILQQMNMEIEAVIDYLNQMLLKANTAGMIVSVVLLVAVTVMISLSVSIRIMEKKQF